MDKEEIRAWLLKKRDEYSKEIWNEASRTIERTILKSDLYKECDKLLLYADFHAEVGTVIILEDALLNGKEVYLPKVLESFEEARMDFFKIDSSFELMPGYMGIMEPMASYDRVFDYEISKNEKILMLVPGVAFAKDGSRLGYGKGYYDNYLLDKPAIMTLGLCFSYQILDSLPTTDSDVRLNFLVNEKTTVEELDPLKYPVNWPGT